MDQAFYFVRAGQSEGPVSGFGLVELVLQGVLKENALVWRNGMEKWAALCAVPELAQAVAAVEAAQPAAKRQRLAGSAGPPPPEVQEEVPAWAEALDERSQVALFERALFHHLEDAIKGRPALRDELLTAYVQRHPASDNRDPGSYSFTDAFLLEAVEDFDDQKEMWEVLGAGNEAAVRGLISAAARTDRPYCAQLQNLALLSRARRLVAQGGEGAGEALAALLREEPALALARDQEGRSLWHDLAAGEHADLLRMLLPLAGGKAAGAADGQQREQQQQQRGEAINPINLTDFNGSTPLHLAAEASNVEVGRLLLDAGALLDVQNRDASKYASGDWSVRSRDLNDFAIPVPSLHQTPLHIAAEAGDLDMLALLVQRGATLDIRDTSGATPLHLALEAQDERAVELLLKAGADPALASNDMAEGATCLSVAASQGKPGLLRLLLDSDKLGAAVNRPEAQQGFTPLMLAARRGSKDCVELLLAAGADPSAVNAAGRSALDVATVNKRVAVAEVLQQAQQQRKV